MFKIEFKIHGNPDRCESDWNESRTISAYTMRELREEVRRFQQENDIGGGNWGEAKLHHDNTFLGFVSYNLRVWAKPYWEPGSVEIIV